MSLQKFDSAAYKAGQRRDWTAAAEGWRKWWRHVEAMAGPVGDRLIQLAAVRAGHRVLDVATGIGEPAVTAARLVGPAGRVVGTVDIADSDVLLRHVDHPVGGGGHLGVSIDIAHQRPHGLGRAADLRRRGDLSHVAAPFRFLHAINSSLNSAESPDDAFAAQVTCSPPMAAAVRDKSSGR